MYNKTLGQVVEQVSTDIDKGISSAEANERLLQNGKNLIKESGQIHPLTRFFRQFKNLLIIVLLAAMVMTIVLAIIDSNADKIIDAALIGLIVLINASVGFFQESKAEKAIAALKSAIQPYAKVVRNGEVIKVKTYELVIGDIVLLEAGDVVPADLRLFEVASLMIEEASLTGESVPSEKTTDSIECNGSVALGDQKNMAFMNGVVTYGRGKGIVVATGMQTQIGLIADHLNKEKKPQTPLQKRLHRISKYITMAVGIIAAIIFITRAVSGDSVTDSIMITIAIAVCAIPEGMPACVTITMALAVQRMSKKKAIIRNLPAVETLGSTEIICSDKTGTLTLNKMTVQSFWTKTGTETYEIDKKDIKTIDKLTVNANFTKLVNCMLLCNDTKTRLENGVLSTIGDPTETALVHCAHIFNFCKEYADEKFKRFDEIPFDSERKLMSTANMYGELPVLFTKGALDNLIGRCTKIYDNGKIRAITPSDVKEIERVSGDFAKRALRVLGYAYKLLDTQPKTGEKNKIKSDDENDLVFIGFTGMIDPPREEVYESIKTCKSAGIAVVMITGDHKDTAFAIAKEIGIADTEDQVMTGHELEAMNDEELLSIISKIRVYARVNPEHKVRIVKAFKSLNKVVAMTGDGVNDAPSIKAADIGIGMGITGTDVTKGVADVILTDDNFATIVSAVKEGRRTYDNILKILTYLLALHLAEVILLTSIIVAFNLPFFNPLLILWINVITGTMPAIALGAVPASKDIMHQRPNQGKIFKGRTGVDILFYAFCQVIFVLVVYLVAMYAFGWDPIIAITMSYLVLGTIEAVHAYNLYHSRSSLLRENAFNNLFFNISIGISAFLVIGSIALPIGFFHNVMGISQLNVTQWMIGLSAGLAIIPLAEIYKFVYNKINKRRNKQNYKV